MAGENNLSAVNTFECDECGFQFKHKKNLYAHKRNIHGVFTAKQRKKQGIDDPVIKAESNSKFSCPTCHGSLSSAASLARHIRTQHPEIQTVQQPKSRLICPADNCKECFTTYKTLRNHLSTVHDFNLVRETFTFKSESEFKEWKTNYEKYNETLYVSSTGPKKSKNDSTKTYYHCHCSLSYKAKGKNIRKMKSAGSKKMGTACPSTMNVLTTPNSIHVEFWKNHMNCNSKGHIFLSKPERAQLAAKLQQGMSFERILDEIRNEALKAERLQRIHQLQRRDLHNIIRDFNIKYIPREHSNDGEGDENSLSNSENDNVKDSNSNINPPKATNKIAQLAEQVISLSSGVSEDLEREVSESLVHIIQMLSKSKQLNLRNDEQKVTTKGRVKKQESSYKSAQKCKRKKLSFTEQSINISQALENSSSDLFYIYFDHKYTSSDILNQ